ncbi:MAG: glycosyltransferase family 87 protein [Parvularculaceae bacterium]
MPGWLKDADWIDAARVRRVSIVVILFSLVGLAGLVATSDGMRDYQGRPLGADFSNVWAAGRMALDGRAAEAYDWAAHHAEQQKAFADPATPFYGWHYPPFFLIAAAALAFLPYTAAWGLWMAATAPLYLAAMRAIAPLKGALIAAVAFPAVFVNVTHGQNGFLTAALIGAALLVLDRRPAVAGVLIGLLAYKPQFGVLIPLVLLVTGRWKTFGAAAATVLMLSALTTALFGAEIWRAFLDSGHLTRAIVLESGNTGWEKIQSIFSALRALGAPVGAAYAAQGALFLAVAASLIWVWRGPAPHGVKAAALIIGSLLATPYVMDYDLMALGPAMGFFIAEGVKSGFRPYEKSALALAFVAPIIARPVAEATFVPLGLIALVALFALALRRARDGAMAQPAPAAA